MTTLSVTSPAVPAVPGAAAPEAESADGSWTAAPSKRSGRRARLTYDGVVRVSVGVFAFAVAGMLMAWYFSYDRNAAPVYDSVDRPVERAESAGQSAATPIVSASPQPAAPQVTSSPRGIQPSGSIRTGEVVAAPSIPAGTASNVAAGANVVPASARPAAGSRPEPKQAVAPSSCSMERRVLRLCN